MTEPVNSVGFYYWESGAFNPYGAELDDWGPIMEGILDGWIDAIRLNPGNAGRVPTISRGPGANVPLPGGADGSQGFVLQFYGLNGENLYAGIEFTSDYAGVDGWSGRSASASEWDFGVQVYGEPDGVYNNRNTVVSNTGGFADSALLVTSCAEDTKEFISISWTHKNQMDLFVIAFKDQHNDWVVGSGDGSFNSMGWVARDLTTRNPIRDGYNVTTSTGNTAALGTLIPLVLVFTGTTTFSPVQNIYYPNNELVFDNTLGFVLGRGYKFLEAGDGVTYYTSQNLDSGSGIFIKHQ